ncbi:MAG: biopolymer transporter ExbD [Kiritimatiellae bacterium]|nr:biopolymer transporter ExbD [Kiritimatiellia bacterium]
MAKLKSEECAMDMTPMIDVVFQLIIFFVVTLKMTDDTNKDIILEEGKDGETLTQDNMPPTTLEIEVDEFGKISIHNAKLSPSDLAGILRNRVNKYGNEFPVLIRADKRTQHKDVKRVMDVCTASGVWKLSFVAIQEQKAGKKGR